MSAGGGARAPSYGTNQAFVPDSHTVLTATKTSTSYRSVNDGQPQPDEIRFFGYSQQQADPGAQSSITSQVTINPGLGATYRTKAFRFTTILNEAGKMEGEPPYHLFLEGDGQVLYDAETNSFTLIPTGVEGVTVGLYPRVGDISPPVWYIDLLGGWFSESTTSGSLRVSVTFELVEDSNTTVTSNKSVESGAKVYKYSQKVGRFSPK